MDLADDLHAAVLVDLTANDRSAFVDVIALAFALDPWFMTLFGAGRDGRRKIRDFLSFLFDLSLWTGADLRGLRLADRLVGAYILERPDARQSGWPRVVWRALSGRIGLSWRNVPQLLPYMRHTRMALPRGRCNYLTLIGVAEAQRGHGLGRRMLDDILARVDQDATSVGVGLDTENPANVRLYERFGFRVTARAAVSGVDVTCLFRPRGADGR